MRNNLQPWRKPYIAILTIVTIICILAGLGMHVFSFFGFLSRTNSFTLVTMNDTFGTPSSIEKMDLELALGDVEIVYGDSLSVDYTYPEECLPKVKFENDKLEIKQTAKYHINDGDAYNNCKMTITVPKDCSITKINASLSMGNLEIKELTANKVNINCNMGNVEISTLNCDTFKAECSMGNISVYGGSLGDVDADCAMGNVELLNVTFDTGKIDCALGNIDIIGEYNDLNTNCGLGSVTVNGKTIKG